MNPRREKPMSIATPLEKVTDARSFWKAVGLRAVATTIVTAEAGDGPRGFLGLSATHLCASPPTMMVSVDKKTSALEAIQAARHFAINYLNADQGDLIAPFGGRTDLKGADRFTTANWGVLATGAPVLENAVGAIDCSLQEIIIRHETAIVIGTVEAFTSTAGVTPLISYMGGTATLAPSA
jgi:flavin reductase (DIM6/NTAB) family NADH-FMN oxidoreductase RutF